MGRIDGYGSITEFLSRQFYRLVVKRMHQHDKTVLWEKYRVTRREPLYLLFQQPRIGCVNSKPCLEPFIFQ